MPEFRVIHRVLLFVLPTSKTGGSDARDTSRSTGNPQVLLHHLDLSPVEGGDTHQPTVFQTADPKPVQHHVEITRWAFSGDPHPSMILRAKGCHEFVAIEPVNASAGGHPDHTAAVLEHVHEDLVGQSVGSSVVSQNPIADSRQPTTSSNPERTITSNQDAVHGIAAETVGFGEGLEMSGVKTE